MQCEGQSGALKAGDSYIAGAMTSGKKIKKNGPDLCGDGPDLCGKN